MKNGLRQVRPQGAAMTLDAISPASRNHKTSAPDHTAQKPQTGTNDQGSFPLQQLLRIARQSEIAEPLACASSLTLLSTSRAVHRSLIRILKPLGLSEGRFVALVTLYTLDPIPCSSADLAYHTEMTRPAMTCLLDTLEARGWIRRRRRLNADRRFSQVSLTERGRKATVFAIYQFLKAAAEISEDVGPAQHKLLGEVCARMRQRSLHL